MGNARGQQGEASRVKMSGSEKNTSDQEHKQQKFGEYIRQFLL